MMKFSALRAVSPFALALGLVPGVALANAIPPPPINPGDIVVAGTDCPAGYVVYADVSTGSTTYTECSPASGGGGGGGAPGPLSTNPVYYDTSGAIVPLTNPVTGTGTVTITNVANGALSSTSTDAVNGQQLYATNNAIASVAATANAALPTTGGTMSGNINMGGNAITNLANGSVTASSTDAVNGQQLYAVQQLAGQGWNITTGASGTGTASGSSVQQVASGSTATFNAGNNLSVTQSGSTVTYALAPSLTGLTSVSVTGGPSITSTGINMGALPITNLANGSLTATSSDAVTGQQLYATNQNVTAAQNTANAAQTTADAAQASAANLTTGLSGVASSFGGGAAYNPVTGVFTQPTYTVQGGTYTNVGSALTALDAAVVAAGGNAVAYDSAARTNVTLGGTGATAPVGLTNLANGSLTATSRDAVNGQQLYATNQNVAANTTAITNLTNAITTAGVGLVQQTGGAPGGGAITVGANTGGTSIDVAGTSGTRTVTGVSAGTLSAASTDAVNGSQLYATNQTVAAMQATADGALQRTGGTMSGGINMGGNAITNLANGSLTATSTDAVNGSQLYATNLNVTNLTNALNTGAVGLVQQTGGAPGAGTITVGANTGGTSVSLTGTSGDRTLTGLAVGQVTAMSSDAVTGAQLYATNQNVTAAQNTANSALTSVNVLRTDLASLASSAVTYDNATRTSVTFNQGAAPATLHNVAGGALSATSTDAVNGSQLFATNQAVASLASSSRSYTDTQISALRSDFGAQFMTVNARIDGINVDLRNLRRDTNGGIASTAALASLPQSINPGRFNLAIGTALRSGEMGVAMGASYRTKDDRGTLNARLATDRGGTTAAVAVGVEF